MISCCTEEPSSRRKAFCTVVCESLSRAKTSAAGMPRTALCEMKPMASDSHGIPVGMKSVDSRWTIPVGGMATALAGCGFVIA